MSASYREQQVAELLEETAADLAALKEENTRLRERLAASDAMCAFWEQVIAELDAAVVGDAAWRLLEPQPEAGNGGSHH